ncbi:MAG: pyruvate formate-lyase [Lachnospiraceae bacterium]|nr:pyruvate formate-lyase [Lachnospiraceae bacterium]
MTERIQKQLQNLKSEEYKSRRSDVTLDITDDVADKTPLMKSALLFRANLACEDPIILPDDRIGFYRSKMVGATYEGENSINVPKNIIPDYEMMLTKGMDQVRSEVVEKANSCDDEQKDFYDSVCLTLDAALEFADRYRESAKKAGSEELYKALCQVPHKAPETLLEACVFLKFIIFTLHCNRNAQIPFGRFDQYMRPYYEHDLKHGISREELLELIEEFFISVNYDGDLYPGMQQGDNGQSLMLGGCDKEGNNVFSDFSKLCMEASLELKLIDPKINLRVDKNTPIELLEFATVMTKQGLGFPQYNNDDIVIPGLVKLGYSLEDARDYAVAACWEFIIPAKGMDIPNVTALSFPKIIARTVESKLNECNSFEELLNFVEKGINEECDKVIAVAYSRKWEMSPYLSVYIRGCIESGKDVAERGAVYNNFGFHGTGIATAADSLAAIKEVIYDKGIYTKEELLEALSLNFEGYNELRNRLLSCPKMGNNIPGVDGIADRLMDAFSNALKEKEDIYGRRFRPGTGSAMYYISSAEKVPATADGRKAGEPFGSSFSPSLECRLNGPLSCIKSFTKHDMTEIINGGPLTMEIHSSTFRNDEGIKKVAQLVKAFIDLGGHQLQLNSINRDTLLDALDHPERHKNLIVRVWGWSGYFVELERKYQEHIIKRTEFMF